MVAVEQVQISAIVGAGGTLAFTITSAGSGYVNPEIIISEPNYDNLPVIGISRQGIGLQLSLVQIY